MSHQNTPHMNKRPDPKPVLDANSSVLDAQATNAKQLLNAYVYDFLIKSRLPQTARIFVNEAEVPSIPTSGNSSSKNSPQTNKSAQPGATPQTPNYQQLQKENNLPNLAVAMDAPQGFLFEWWQIFWDVFQAKTANGAKQGSNPTSQFASQYYQLQLMKQRQQQDMQGMNVQPNVLDAASFQQQQGIPQLMAARSSLQAQQAAAAAAAAASGNTPVGSVGTGGQPGQFTMQGQPPQLAGPLLLQQPQQVPNNMPPHLTQQQMALLDPQQQQRFMMQMMAKQQQQQQQQQNKSAQGQQAQVPNGANAPVMDLHQALPTGPNGNLNLQQQLFMQQSQQNPQPQNRIQQQAQTQMHNLRQQAAVAAQQQQQQAQVQAQAQSHGPVHGQPFDQANSAAAAAAAAAQNARMQNGQPLNSNINYNGQDPLQFNPQQQQQQQHHPQQPQQHQQGPPPGQMMRMNSVSKAGGQPMAGSPMLVNNGNGVNVNANTSRNMNALQDYQMQLMLLEKQNKKRLDIARSNGGDAIPGQNTMFPPQEGLPNGSTHNTPAIPSKPSPDPSPVIGNKPSPGNGAKRKKEPAVKRGRKASNPLAPNSAHTTPITAPAPAPSLLKKEYNTPLTPASEDNSTTAAKRKRKNTGTDSPKKQVQPSTAGKKAKNGAGAKDTVKKKEEDIKAGASKTNMPPPSTTVFQNNIGQLDQIFPEILGGLSNTDQTFFGGAGSGNGGLDDIDFDFNSFLEGTAGDGGMGDGIGGFSWGNVDAIEGGD